MAQIVYTGSAAEILQLAKNLKFAVAGLSDNRRYSVTIDNAPGGGSTWSVIDPGGNTRKG